MQEALNFQSMILSLQKFWAEHGCLIGLPYNERVGAGTMNPATFLRVLGPEPWNVAYVEPSVRPDDGRFGENPNRLQQHHQFQVILKPDPGNPQELYLQSLEALGIDPHEHDIRFVEDNWQSPALGAWGLGWEVWLDGLEITQFTYFQQAGGFPADPVSVEITYGLERIAMALQHVRSFRDIHWSDSRTYGDVLLQAEQEESRYYFETANVDNLRKMYDLFESEARIALDNGLVLPAHDYILKCSHTFNVLDARGAIGFTERQAMFARMRDLARRTAEAYINQRQTLEFPWGDASSKTAVAAPEPDVKIPVKLPESADLLFEIGTEELPVDDLGSALEQLGASVPALLEEVHLDHGEVRILGTPRRLVVSVARLMGRQVDRVVVVKGPPAARAYDKDGKLTPAAEGFARGKGVKPADLQVRDIDGGSYIVAELHEKGRSAVEVLAENLPALIAGIKFDRTMRWNSSQVAFSRPIRWLLALYGSVLIPFNYAGLISGSVTRGLRSIEPEEFKVKDAAGYFTALEKQGILLDPQKRRDVIAKQVKACVQGARGKPELDDSLLDEVNQLVEAPTALLGDFDASYLRLPEEVLVSVMKKHQRYFPVKDGNGKLLPHFMVVRNGDGEHGDIVTDGNQQVILARFADADFFIKEDLHHKLEDLLPRIGTLTFQQRLGSMLDKTHRIEILTHELIKSIEMDSKDRETLARAAHLCKADLGSKMVVEMTSLQGVIGRFYALESGESEDVAQAIFEHYLPRYAGDQLPKSKPGLVIGMADRLDSLTGLFAAGLAPTGTKDPFAQRRTAMGLVQILADWNLDLDVRACLALAAKLQPVPASDEALKNCLDFITGRLQSWQLDLGARYDVVNSVLSAQAKYPARSVRAIRELTTWVNRKDWQTILPAYARCVRITRDQRQSFVVEPALMTEKAEKDLYKEVVDMEHTTRKEGSVDDLLNAFLPVIPVINSFFDAVLVMAEDEKLRANRLGLLQRIAALTKGIADLSQLEGF